LTNGYNNKALDVDLTAGTIQAFPIDDRLIRSFLGGRGLGVHFLTKALSPTTPPLSEESVLVVSAGGLGGSLTPSNSRFSVAFKSPLTHTISSSNSGGTWGTKLKQSGHDVVLIRGRAGVPVYLNITEESVHLVACPELWGMTIPQVTADLAGRYSHSTKVLTIGPAGENGVLFAAMINEGSHAVGRGGAGAVMGAKNLKAIVVSGNKKFKPADEDRYKAGVYQARKLIRSMPVTSKALPALGTAGLVHLISAHDMLPHHNFRDTTHTPDQFVKISGENIREQILTGKKGCLNCPIACSRKTRVGRLTGEGPEYETIGMIGANLGIYDIEEIALANYRCNDLGMDTISFGNTVGLMMELFETGVIGQKDTGGLDLKFGTHGLIEDLAEATAHRRGMGEAISQGAARGAKRYGAGPLAMVVKGLELPAYDPRASLLQALGYATSSRGGCHLKGGYGINLGFFGGPRQVDRFLVDTVAGHIVNLQDSGCVADMLGICRFAFFSLSENELSRIFSGFTGIDLGPNDLQQAAKRIQDMERQFNNAAGFTREDDALPDRFFNEEILIDHKMRAIDRATQFDHMLDKYYEIRGWNREGVPEQQ